MSSLGSDQRQENGTAATLPSSPTGQSSAVPEERTLERKLAVLGPTLVFIGDLSAEEDFILQGKIQGSIHHTQRLIVGTGGAVVGNVYARVVVVDGCVEGDLHGIESVSVHETGRVVGNIYAPRVGLVDGAVFNGRIDMTGTAVVTQIPTQGANQTANLAAPQPVNGAAVGNLAKKRVDSPTMNPGQPLTAEETEKVLTPKVVLVPPAPPRAKTG